MSSSESTSDSRTIHDVIDSFSAAPSPSLGAGSSGGGEQLHLSAAQLEQLREQIAVSPFIIPHTVYKCTSCAFNRLLYVYVCICRLYVRSSII